MHERPVKTVPVAVIGMLLAGLAGQVVFRATAPSPAALAQDLPPAPQAETLMLFSVGEPIALAKLAMIYLQAFDYRSNDPVPYRNLDYGRLETWLERILELDPAGQYPLLAASRIYAEVPDEAKERQMLEFVFREFLVDPNRRWPWLAHAAILAKHQLKDLRLALRYAEALERHTSAENAPAWVRQMRAFVLEDLDELEAARVIIGGYIASGEAKDPAEMRFLEQRLQAIEARLGSDSRAR